MKRHAAETSVDVMKTIAEVKAKAAEEIAASAVTLAQLQQQQTVSTMEALNQVCALFWLIHTAACIDIHSTYYTSIYHALVSN